MGVKPLNFFPGVVFFFPGPSLCACALAPKYRNLENKPKHQMNGMAKYDIYIYTLIIMYYYIYLQLVDNEHV